ncbi:terpenoid synthase [Rhizopogon salebrosus TDB-379]|nr:terpenoid synthase [Rhizopogon salebrosus TDB-379]
MTATEGISYTTTLDNKALASTRQAIATFLQRCSLQYTTVTLDEDVYAECCQEAINRGLPMDGKYSIRPFLAVGVAIMSLTYAHLPDRSTGMWICLYTAVCTCIDDIVDKRQDIAHVYRFNERFATCEPQEDAVLNGLDALLREAVHHFSPLVSNLVVASSLNFVSSLLLDHETKDMEISTDAPLYPEYSRLMSGLADAYGLFIFPTTLPLVEYIQCMPDLAFVINHTNDILSYYKEELEGETVNYLSLMAASHGLAKQAALHELIEKTVQAHHNVIQILKPRSEACDAFLSFFHGYFGFHAALRRYKLEEIMSERSDS